MKFNCPLLETRGLTAFYGDFQALYSIDFRIERNETVTIIGSNGAGKSTLLKSIIGQVRVKAGEIYFNGKNMTRNPAFRIVETGISMVPEGRHLFASLSVEENLLIGAYSKRQGPWNLETVYAIFPMLRDKRKITATTLSGGEQQMVAIGRALMENPQLLLCDEVSLGLAPVIVKEIYAEFRRVTANITSLVIVEQDIRQAMTVSDRVYCMREGRVVLEGRPSELGREELTKAYFGI
jgi:branched-chain amino acid transport system ATP-binding protein